ncbi:MAG: MBOAT family O-acyltransferase [Oscillospiraceae bacterium]
MIFSAAVDYINGLIIDRYHGKFLAKIALFSSIFINLGLLSTFKYSNFIVENVNALLGTSFDIPSFALPIGISFYTFQTISYVIDIYRGQVKAQRSFFKFFMYVSLFHQLVAGPIVRYSHIAHGIDHRKFDINDIVSGITRFCVGLSKKVLIANVAGSFVVSYMDADPATLSVLGAWFGVFMFSIQIYFDFSGYSDMAIGLGKMFGFHYFENFNYPYIAKSATDFWRRWHISLGGFFRDYVYIPLGGNRKRGYLNLLIVWFLTGLWHGSSWNFILWGLFYALLIMIERAFLLKLLSKIPSVFAHCYLIGATLIAWTIFYFSDLSSFVSYFKVMFGFSPNPINDLQLSLALFNNGIWILFAIFFCLPIIPAFKKFISMYFDANFLIILNYLQTFLNIAMLLICTSMLIGESYNPFLYFRF